MSVTTIAIVIALPFLVAGAALVASSEAAIFSLTFGDRLRLRRNHPRAAEAIQELLARPNELLVTLLFSNMMFITMFFVLTSMLLAEAAAAGKAWLGILISIVDLIVVMVIAEIASKMLAVRRRVEVARYNALPVLWLVRALAPLRRVALPMIIEPLTRLFLPPGREETPSVSTEELASLLAVGAEEGAIDPGEQRVLEQVLRLGETRVQDVMTPRVEMDWLDISATPDDVVALARERRRTRVPVCKGSLDQGVIGVLDVKRYLAVLARSTSPPALRAFLDPPRFVPHRATLDRLLEQLRAWGVKVALCVDEHGSVVGVVSARTVASQVASELSGQDADGQDFSRATPEGEGRWLVPGRFPARALAEMLEFDHVTRVSTVSGLVLSLLGRPPALGDTVMLGNVRLTVRGVNRRVPSEVGVELRSAADPPERMRRKRAEVRA
ncbi:MAG: hemolysin family protein [Phycisphaerales bacterium]